MQVVYRTKNRREPWQTACGAASKHRLDTLHGLRVAMRGRPAGRNDHSLWRTLSHWSTCETMKAVLHQTTSTFEIQLTTSVGILSKVNHVEEERER